MSLLQPRADGRVYGATLRERILLFSLPIESGCWIWQRCLDDKGYPRLRVRDSGEQYAHRASHSEFNGPIPESWTVDHLCFTPACVNPAHLRTVPNDVNAARQRSFMTGRCKRGHELTPDNVRWQKNRRHPDRPHRTCRTCEALRKEARRAS